MGTVLAQAQSANDPTGWAHVREIFTGEVSSLLPTAVVLVIVAGVLLLILSRWSAGDNVEAAQLVALVTAGLVSFTMLLTVAEIQWSSVIGWAVVAAIALELPKTLAAFRYRALARRVGAALAVAFALPLALTLARGEFVPTWWPFTGVLLGTLLNFALLGPTSLVGWMTGANQAEEPDLRVVRRAA